MKSSILLSLAIKEKKENNISKKKKENMENVNFIQIPVHLFRLNFLVIL